MKLTRSQLIEKHCTAAEPSVAKILLGHIDRLIAAGDIQVEPEPVEDVGMKWAVKFIDSHTPGRERSLNFRPVDSDMIIRVPINLDDSQNAYDLILKMAACHFAACHADGFREGMEMAAKIAQGIGRIPAAFDPNRTIADDIRAALAELEKQK